MTVTKCDRCGVVIPTGQPVFDIESPGQNGRLPIAKGEVCRTCAAIFDHLLREFLANR